MNARRSERDRRYTTLPVSRWTEKSGSGNDCSVDTPVKGSWLKRRAVSALLIAISLSSRKDTSSANDFGLTSFQNLWESVFWAKYLEGMRISFAYSLHVRKKEWQTNQSKGSLSFFFNFKTTVFFYSERFRLCVSHYEKYFYPTAGNMINSGEMPAFCS